MSNLKAKIREVPDFPKKGILFLDITTALKDKDALKEIANSLYNELKDMEIDYVAGVEARGFIFGAQLATMLDAGFVPVRKPNKLPAATIKETYDLEYGTDTIEIHADSFEKGAKVVVIDDLLATGGTAAAAVKLIKKAGGEVVAATFVIELTALNGRKKLEDQGVNVISLLKY
ncbi:adenine phosphoribosyltransferase [bacterium]|nr:adenine phosphoribosyltransferase [bacterium]